MPLSADRLLDRIRLKSALTRWRFLAILIAILFALSFFSGSGSLSDKPGEHIARLSVSGIIVEDRARDDKLAVLKNDKNVRAVIVYINSPGGTIVGGETLYTSLREIAKIKPVVAVMGSVAASGGYMAAIAADHIIARSGTVTGSIGVMLQTAEVSELSRKIGINFQTFKSGNMKAVPSPFEKVSPKARQIINASIKDSYDFFMGLVKERRSLNGADIAKISDGRIFTGRQAIAVKLVDSLGGENEALKWLQEKRKINVDLKVKDVNIKSEKLLFKRIFTTVMGRNIPYMTDINGGGIMALWKPGIY